MSLSTATSARDSDVRAAQERDAQERGAPGTAPLGPGGKPPLIRRRLFPTPLHRRVAYAILFEAFAVLFTTLILSALGNSAGASALIGVVSSVVALIWNLVFNSLFERWERRSGHTGRPLRIRLLHTLLFEGGLMMVLIPAVALILQVSVWEAFLYEAGLIVFFLVYNALYAWCFDRVFGLPDSARQGSG